MNRHTRLFAAVAVALGTLPVAGVVHAVDNPPTTPAEASTNRYSATAGGVSWTRSTDDKGAVRGYEVFRDGTPLGIRDALSVSEKSLVAGKSYLYSIAAVDSAGQRSVPVRITLNAKGVSRVPSSPSAVAPAPTKPTAPAKPATGPADGGLPAKVATRMKTVFDVANADAAERVVAIARSLANVQVGPRAGYKVLRRAVDAKGTEGTTLGCPEGGKVDVVRVRSTLPGIPPLPRYYLQGCDTGPLKLDGQLDDNTALNGNVNATGGLTVLDQRDGSTLRFEAGVFADVGRYTGSLERWLGHTGAFGEHATSGNARPYATVANLGGTASGITSETGRSGTGFYTTFDLRIGAERTLTSVRTPLIFRGVDAAGNFAVGRMVVEGSGYRYELNADNGDARSFQLDVTENGSSTSYTVPWSNDLRIDRFDPRNYGTGL